ncbi:Protein E6 [Hibiscus syriacus]|uniref:Protein E6 n=1 Tax=Hibiscus syriacus TaxID=106335 RepID=A0A6A3AQI7_HIBSY|nr:Protein E6 [Hibiscus syriacus]
MPGNSSAKSQGLTPMRKRQQQQQESKSMGPQPPKNTGEPSFTTKETYEPYVIPIKYHLDEPYNNIPESGSNNKNTYYHNKNAYQSTEKQNLGKASFSEKGWSTKENQNNNYYDSNNIERQGMSDTRYLGGVWFAGMFMRELESMKELESVRNWNPISYFVWKVRDSNSLEKLESNATLEYEKYYYDIRSENYYPNQFHNSRGVASRNEFNENRYNNKGRYNQNQEEFLDTEEEFEP